jgi:hypothetical protein
MTETCSEATAVAPIVTWNPAVMDSSMWMRNVTLVAWTHVVAIVIASSRYVEIVISTKQPKKNVTMGHFPRQRAIARFIARFHDVVILSSIRWLERDVTRVGIHWPATATSTLVVLGTVNRPAAGTDISI